MDVTKGSKLFGLAALLVLLCACENTSKNASVPYNNSLKDGTCAGRAIEDRYVIKWKDGQLTGATFKSESEMREVLSHFADDIENVENDQLLTSHDVYSQSDVTQADLAAANWGQTSVEASNAWNQNVKGSDVIVAVVDSGVDRTHPQISPRLAINPGEIAGNGIDDDGNGLIDDVSGFWFLYEDGSYKDTPNVVDTTGHGTHVAGIIAADQTTGTIQGMAPLAKILPVGFMSGNGSGSGSMLDATRGIFYAVSRGAKIINASWGGAGCSTTLRDAIAGLESQGVLFVDASGNMGANIDNTPEYPAGFGLAGQIAVGAYGPAGYQSQFSNFSRSLVHLLAPGEDIISTYPGNTTKKMSGTSMASPFVAGTAALLMGERPQATVAQIKQAILSSVVPGNFEVVSRGKLNVKNALAAIRAIIP